MRTKFSQSHGDDPFNDLNLAEIGEDLVEEANHYIKATDDLIDMTGPELATQLDKMLETPTIEFLLSSGDYGRGFLSGLAAGIFALEVSVDAKLAKLEDDAGGEDDVDDEDIEEVILDALKHGTRGGGEPTDGETIN